eukprot:COSAG03_NODE_1686_length_3648_cov_13.038039_3_plen_160_part_00
MVASGVVGDRADDTGYYACHLVSPSTKNSPVLKGYLDGLGAGRFFTFVTPRMDFHASGLASGESLNMPASILGADGRTYHARYALVRGDGAAKNSFVGTGERMWPYVRFARMVFGTFYPSVPSPRGVPVHSSRVASNEELLHHPTASGREDRLNKALQR